MTKTHDLSQEICSFLKSLPAFSGVEIISIYPGIKKPVPLRSTVIAIGTGDVKYRDAGIGQTEIKCADTEIKIHVYEPFTGDLQNCAQILDTVFKSLVFESPYNIMNCRCEQPFVSRNAEAFSAHGTAVLKVRIESERQ